MERLKKMIEDYSYPLMFDSGLSEQMTVYHFAKKGGLLCVIVKVLRALFNAWCNMPDRHIDRGWLMRLLYQPFSCIFCSANDWGEYGLQKGVLTGLKDIELRLLRHETQKWCKEVLELLEETGGSSQIELDISDNVKIKT